jgi:protein disulfide-isomerase A1
MESTENDLPPSVDFRISGFPTLKFKPAGGTEFIDYEGDRSLESLISFVEKHAKNPIELPEISVKSETDAQAPLADEAKAAEAAAEVRDEL